jgi:chaperonin GroEL
LEQLMAEWIKDLVILAEDVDSDALTAIILNKMKWALNILAIKNPGFWEDKKDILKDISILTWANIITWELGMKVSNTSLSDLWKAKTIISSKTRTTIIWGAWEKSEIENRVWEIIQAIELSETIVKEKLQERLAKLDWWVAVIKVGAASEIEMKEKKLRIEDALNATRAAIEEWVVAGWGIALLRAIKCLDWVSFGNSDQDLAIEILRKVLEYPTKQIIENAGKNSEEIISKILESSDINYWYNANNDEFTDMIKSWIIDPKKVERIALEQAISLSGMFLTTESAIALIPKKPWEIQMPDLSKMWMM